MFLSEFTLSNWINTSWETKQVSIVDGHNRINLSFTANFGVCIECVAFQLYGCCVVFAIISGLYGVLFKHLANISHLMD